jgi:uncharacterized protein (TIGR02996 family)
MDLSENAQPDGRIARVEVAEPVSLLVFDGDELIIACNEVAARRVVSGQAIRLLPLDLRGPWATLPGGSEIAVWREGRIERVRVRTGEVLQSFPCERRVRCLAVSPDGLQIALAREDALDIVDWSGTPIYESAHIGGWYDLEHARFSALAWLDCEGAGYLWALGRASLIECLETDGPSFEEHTSVDEPQPRRFRIDEEGWSTHQPRYVPDDDLTFDESATMWPSPDRTRVALIGSALKLFVQKHSYEGPRPWLKWDKRSHERNVPLPGRPTAFVWESSGEEMAVGFSDGTVRLYNFDGQLVAKWSVARSLVTALAFSRDGVKLAVASEGEVSFWDVPALRQRLIAPEHRNAELEANIRADPGAVEPYLAYAGWLQARGDPRGDLIVVQHRLESATGPEKERLLAEQADLITRAGVGSCGTRRVTVSEVWRRGFVQRLSIQRREQVTLHELLEHRTLQFLEELNSPGPESLTADAPQLTTLRALRISGASTSLRAGVASRIERLEVFDTDDRTTLQDLSRTEWPRLQTLRLYCNLRNFDLLRVILGDQVTPALRELDCATWDGGLQLIRVLRESSVLPRLQSLTLYSYESMAAALLEASNEFEHLRQFTVQFPGMQDEQALRAGFGDKITIGR